MRRAREDGHDGGWGKRHWISGPGRSLQEDNVGDEASNERQRAGERALQAEGTACAQRPEMGMQSMCLRNRK